MKVTNLMVCRYVEVNNQLFYIQGGGITQVRAKQFPVGLALGLAILIEAETLDAGKHKIEITFRDPDGKALASTDPELDVTKIRRWNICQNLPVLFPRPGPYSFQVKIDGQEKGSWSIEALPEVSTDIPSDQ